MCDCPACLAPQHTCRCPFGRPLLTGAEYQALHRVIYGVDAPRLPDELDDDDPAFARFVQILNHE